MNEDLKMDNNVVQELRYEIGDVNKRVNEVWCVINNLGNKLSYLHNELEKCQRQYEDLRKELHTSNGSDYEFMYLQQLSDYLPSHPAFSTIKMWCKQGKIPHHEIGKVLYFFKDEIYNWLKNEL